MADKLYIENYIGDRDTLIQEAMQHPTMAPKRKPTIELALKAILIVVERRVREAVAAEFAPKLEEAFSMYEIMGVDRATLELQISTGEIGDGARDDWESGLDDLVEATLEPYQEYLSADWLGTHTIEVHLWEEGVLDKYAQDVGKEIYKQLTYGKTPAQSLANAGITQPEAELYFEQHMEQSQEEETEMAEAPTPDLQIVLDKIAAHVGAAYDPVTVYEALELCGEDDDILADGAGARLGLEHNDVIVLQLYAMDHTEYADELVAMVADTLKAGTPAPKRGRVPKKAENAVLNALNPRVFTLLADHSAAKDTEMAKGLGVSRGTFGNYRTGSSAFEPSDDQKAFLRAQIIADTNGLLEALSIIDGTEAMAVS